MVGATNKKATKKAPKRKKAAPKKSPRKKSAKRKTTRTHAQAETDPELDNATNAAALNEYRQRIGAVGRLMQAALADLEETHAPADRIGQGAYLQVMGRAFEVLDGLSQTIEVDDLVKISKVIAEQRRAELNHRKLQLVDDAASSHANRNGDAESRDIELSESFGEIVRQIYGTTLATDLNGCTES